MSTHTTGRPSRHPAVIPHTVDGRPGPVPITQPQSLRNPAIQQAHPCRFPFGEPALPVPVIR